MHSAADTIESTTSSAITRLRIDWRAEALVLALSIAEAAVLWLIVDLIFGASEGDTVRVPFLAVALPVIVGSGLPRWLDALDVWDRVYAVGVVVGVLVTTLIAIKFAAFPDLSWSSTTWLEETVHALVWRPNPERVSVWGMVIVSAVTWWRGKTRAEPELDAAVTTLRYGTVAAVVAAVGQASVRDEGTGVTSAAVLVFFVAALAAVAIGRLKPEGLGQLSSLGTRWLGPMLAPVLVVTLGAVIATGLLTRSLLDTILWFLSPLIWALGLLVRIVILTLALIAFIILSPILWLLSLHPIEFKGVRIDPQPAQPDDQVRQAVDKSSQMPDAIRYLIAAAILLILFTGVTKLVLRQRRRAAVTTDEERSSVLDADGLLGYLKSLWGSRFGRSGPPDDPLAGLRGNPRWADTVTIRETYGQFLTWSNEQGKPRRTNTTPSEHERNVRARETTTDLATLTTNYNATRYSDQPATSDDAAVVRQAWERLRGEPTP